MSLPPPGVTRWRLAALVAVSVTALLPIGVTRWARGRYARALAARSAVSTAAYLALVTRAARGAGATGYDLPQLLIWSRALAELPGFHAEVEVYHGTAPLVDATASPLALGTLAALRREAGAGGAGGVRWTGNAALAPLFDRAGWDVVGAVEARAPIPEGPLLGWVAVAFVFALALGMRAVGAVGGSRAALRPAFRRYACAAGLLGLLACADVRVAARDVTDLWLTDARLLMQDAAARLPEARGGPASLAPIARDAELVAGDSAGPDPRRREVAGLPRASVAVRLRPGRWAELRTAPEEGRAGGWMAAAFVLALLGPLGVTGAAWGFLAPSALHLAVFSFAPLAFALYLSVHRWSLIEPVRPFVGLANYARLFHDTLVWTSLRNTVVYVLYVPVSMALALALALVLSGRSWGARALRAVFFLPSVASAVAIALVWQRMYQPDGGLIAALLSRAHIGPVDWLGDPKAALIAVMVLSVWVQLGFQMTLFCVGLQGIPQAYLDAARVDGAGAWQRFRRVTFPLLRHVTLFVLVSGIIGAFQVITYVYVLTGGGPIHATDVVVYRMYQTAWEFAQFGSASALAVLVLVVLGGVTWAQFRLLGKRVEYA